MASTCAAHFSWFIPTTGWRAVVAASASCQRATRSTLPSRRLERNGSTNAKVTGCAACGARIDGEQATPAQKENDMKPDSASEDSNDLRNPLWILAYGMACFFGVVAAVMALS